MREENKKVAIITGGTRGIGFETAVAFLQNGYRVIVASNDDEATVKQAVESLSAFGEVQFLYLDMISEENCRSIVEQTVAVYGQIDVLANVAAACDLPQPIFETDMGPIQRIVQIDLLGPVCLALCAAKYMAQRKSGVIINVGSIAGQMAVGCVIGYAIAKGGLSMATKILAKELSPYGIRCVTVIPGYTRTRFFDPSTESVSRHYQLKDRIIEPQEIGDLIYLLTTEDARAINGSSVMAEDGYCEIQSSVHD